MYVVPIYTLGHVPRFQTIELRLHAIEASFFSAKEKQLLFFFRCLCVFVEKKSLYPSHKKKHKEKMCTVQLQNYTSFLDSADEDYVPSILLWSQSDCTAKMFPSDNKTASFPIDDQFPIGQEILVPFAQTFAIFIPFTVTSVTFVGSFPENTSTFRGPLLISNTNLLNWQHGNWVPMTAIRLVIVNGVRDWVQSRRDMCMGQDHTIGSNILQRYNSGTERCDLFMTNEYCVGDTLDNDEACACLKEIPDIMSLSNSLHVDLPVLCFGVQCATGNTYKTNAILSKPCNMTLCEQLLNTTGTETGTIEAMIYCGGKFYDNPGTFALPQTTPLPNQAPPTKPTETPYFVWIILGVSGVLLIFVAMLMFAKTNNAQPLVSNQTSFKPQEYTPTQPILF